MNPIHSTIRFSVCVFFLPFRMKCARSKALANQSIKLLNKFLLICETGIEWFHPRRQMNNIQLPSNMNRLLVLSLPVHYSMNQNWLRNINFLYICNCKLWCATENCKTAPFFWETDRFTCFNLWNLWERENDEEWAIYAEVTISSKPFIHWIFTPKWITTKSLLIDGDDVNNSHVYTSR